MAGPYEHIDDVTASVDGVTDTFSVRKPPYVAGSVRVFVNGFIVSQEDDDGWIEIDAVAGIVRLKETPKTYSGKDYPKDAVHILYQSFVEPFIDEHRPRHIIEIRTGDIVKIAMKPGFHINPYTAPGPTYRGKSPHRGRVALGFSRTVFFGYVTNNDPVNGQMDVTIQKRNSVIRQHVECRILYKHIMYIRLSVTDAVPLIESAPANHPGAKALGTLRRPLAPTLIKIRL